MQKLNSLEELTLPNKYIRFLECFLKRLSIAKNVEQVILFGKCTHGIIHSDRDFSLMIIVDNFTDDDDSRLFKFGYNLKYEFHIHFEAVGFCRSYYDETKNIPGSLWGIEQDGMDLTNIIIKYRSEADKEPKSLIEQARVAFMANRNESEQHFWSIIEQAKEKANGDQKLQLQEITDQLVKLEPRKIIEWDENFQKYLSMLYNDRVFISLRHVKYYSDDSLEYYLAWIISQGIVKYFTKPNTVYGKFLPHGFEDILYVAHNAYKQTTGVNWYEDPTSPYFIPDNHPIMKELCMSCKW